jgi:DNA mismatch endonuclease (patch repair protein)
LPDIVDAQTRSRMMSGIRGKDTKPELLIRRGLHSRGFRYRVHSSHMPGKPDLVFPRFRATVFVHGCFWHSHGCHLFRLPTTRPEFWMAKLARNQERDAEVRSLLNAAGWRCLVIWECALKGRLRLDLQDVLDRAAAWIRGDEPEGEIAGRPA